MEKKFETKGQRTARIIRTVVRHLHDISIRQLASELGCNYMQLYYCSSGKTFELSQEVLDAFQLRYPEFNQSFLRYGTGKLVEGDTSEEEYETTDEEPTSTSITGTNQLGIDDLARLFTRVLDMVDRTREREDIIYDLKNEVKDLKARISKLELNNDNLPFGEN